jgi:hypothetical protein
MKKIILIIAILFMFSSFNQLQAYDTTVAKYLPLQVGNIWVYYGQLLANFYHSTCYYIYKIEGTKDTLGHRYYNFSLHTVFISGNSGCSCTMLSSGAMTLRVDSTTMNVYQTNGCSGYEELLDSLLAKKNDTAWECRSTHLFSACTDTNIHHIFNSNRPSKAFINSQTQTNVTNITYFAQGRTYSKDIGIINFGYSYDFGGCNDDLVGCVINGVLYGDTSTLAAINQISSEIPKEYKLYQNYPNPFNPKTIIRFQITNLSDSKLIIYNALGKEVTTLVNEQLKPGTYETEFDGTNLPSGVYFYKLISSNYTETKRMVLLK